MSKLPFKYYYRRNLPHRSQPGDSFFVTFRLHGSLRATDVFLLRKKFLARTKDYRREPSPQAQRQILDEGKRFFAGYDAMLDSPKTGPLFLKEPNIANIVQTQLHRLDGQLFDLVAYCIMPNHVHILFDTKNQLPEEIQWSLFSIVNCEPLYNIMRRIKGASARYANLALSRQGKKFWQKETFDFYVRNRKEYQAIIRYILTNPVKAGLAKEWQAYDFSYIHPKHLGHMEPVG